MTDRFFVPEQQLPGNVGFALFDFGHLSALVCCGAIILLTLVLSLRRSGKTQQTLLRHLAFAMVVLELAKDLILAVQGGFTLGYLPLHLCSLSMFVCLYFSWHPDSSAGGHILYSVVLPSALCALLFPNWTRCPLLHFQSIHSFLYHTLLVIFVLIPLFSGQLRPGLRGVIPSLAFLLAVSVPVALVNRLLGTNYMFLRSPSRGSPLEFLTLLPGKYGYIMGYFLLVLCVLVALNLPFSLLQKKHV